MKLSSRYLEHLESLGLRHANRLKNWVGDCKLYLSFELGDMIGESVSTLSLI
jgi:hypothetical protein